MIVTSASDSQSSIS